jgi:hypothetical protein
MSVRDTFLFALAVALALLCPLHAAHATTIACEGANDGVQAKKRIVVPKGKREAFIKYIQENGPSDSLSYAAVDSDRYLSMILQNVDAGIIAINIENAKPEHVFLLSVEICNAQADWRPYWEYVLKLVNAFTSEQN